MLPRRQPDSPLYTHECVCFWPREPTGTLVATPRQEWWWWGGDDGAQHRALGRQRRGGRPPCGRHQVHARSALASGVLRGFCEGTGVVGREEQVSVAFPAFLPGGEPPLSCQCPPRSLCLPGAEQLSPLWSPRHRSSVVGGQSVGFIVVMHCELLQGGAWHLHVHIPRRSSIRSH